MLPEPHRLFEDRLGQIYTFSLWPRSEPREDQPASITPNKTYARQILDSIVQGGQDPFHYKLLDLWLEVFRTPWAQPHSLNQLLDDLANKVAEGELFIYLEHSPSWDRPRPMVSH